MILFLVAGIWSGSFIDNIKAFTKQKSFLAVTGIFLLFFISGLWSENTEYFLNRSRIKLPLLFLPFAFFAVPTLSKKVMQRIFLGFIALFAFSVLWSIGLFLLDFNHYVEIYGKGQTLPTPIHHVRYSIMVSIAAAMTIYGIKTWNDISPLLNKVLWAIALMFIFYLHVLAVRSGIMTLYIALGCLLFIYIKEKGNKLWAAGITVSSILLIFLATQFVPTIKNKLSYMQYSLEKFAKNENIRDLSDSRRLGSIFAGLDLTRNNPLLGVGIGDIMDETNAYLAKHYPDLIDLELLPHNQYILTSATLGIIGLLIFILFSFMPLFYLNGYNDYLLLASQFMFFASFMVEHTIESQIGVALYIFITLMAMKNRESQMTNAHA